MAKNIYEVLNVSHDATKDEVIRAYAKKKNALQLERNSGTIETNEFISHLNELDEAKAILLDDDRRKAYDAGNPIMQTGATTGSKPKNKKTVLKKVALGTCIVALAASIVGCSAWGISKLSDKKDKQNSDPTATPYITMAPTEVPTEAPTEKTTEAPTEAPTEKTTEAPTEEQTEAPTPKETEAPVVPSDVPEMVNYGDAKDDALVTERATKLLEEMNANGLYNMGTNAPYTIDEIKTLIQYMNGAYKPQNEDEAYTLVDEFLNFAIAPLNSEQVLFSVQYQGGEDSFKDTVQGYIDNFTRINFVDNMLFGNSSAYPYLKWFEDQYNAMLCTTDREECTRIYDSMMQSLADMVYGDGFTLNGKVYDKNDFLGLDRVNSGNILQLLVYMMEPFRTDTTKNTFTVHNKLLSANPEEQEATVDYLKITEYFNALCEDDLHDISFDDEGYLLIDQPDGKNFSYINQVNTINRALMEYYGKDNAYTNVYQKSLN